MVEAVKKINIPNFRWPGGCFADEYHWRDGIGPRSERPKMINTHWGGVTEDNSFGTHEFLDLCEQLNTEPVICGNVGSGTVEDMSKWVEYLNFDGISLMADERRENGRENAWGVKWWDNSDMGVVSTVIFLGLVRLAKGLLGRNLIGGNSM